MVVPPMGQIYKLQPHRTIALQGFDDYGAAAALWGASDNGFTVSGVFRDLADLVGKTALFLGFKEPVVFSNHFLRIRIDRKAADPRYVASSPW
jgi:hypothetical protein